jgi:hypothetical protein
LQWEKANAKNLQFQNNLEEKVNFSLIKNDWFVMEWWTGVIQLR